MFSRGDFVHGSSVWELRALRAASVSRSQAACLVLATAPLDPCEGVNRMSRYGKACPDTIPRFQLPTAVLGSKESLADR